MTFGERLMELRKSRGLSQESLGDMIDVTRQTVSKWERGDSTPELEKLIELARVFDVSLDELAGLERKAAEGGSEQADDAACTPWRWHYEYKSRRTLFGLPLVHINIGRGMFRARGILAIGTAATGAVAIGPWGRWLWGYSRRERWHWESPPPAPWQQAMPPPDA